MLENSMVIGAADEYERQFPELTKADEDEAREKAAETICTIEFWDGRELSTDDAHRIAQCMALLDMACNGSEVSVNGILTALSRLQKSALLDEIDNVLEG